MGDKKEIKEKNLAYGGSALIEGVLMRGRENYAITVKKTDNNFYKEKVDYVSLGKRIKFFGLPFIRGIIGLFENLIISIKVLNKSAEIAFPEEEGSKPVSNFSMMLILVFSMIIALSVFRGVPYLLASFFKLDHNNNPISYNLVSGIISLVMFFLYIIIISLMKDTKRLFGYHGAEHKTISAYESKTDLIVENIKKYPRLHPRCGTSFIFIVFLISIIIFPFFNLFFNTQEWYKSINNINISLFGTLHLGKIIQRLIHILAHIIIGMPIIASISYELLRLSGKFQKNFFVKILISPGLFFQLFTTREPDSTMIKAALLSLKMILGEEDAETPREADGDLINGIKSSKKMATAVLLLPLLFIMTIF